MKNKNRNYRKGIHIILALIVTANDSNHQVIIISIIVSADNRHILTANRMPASMFLYKRELSIVPAVQANNRL